MISVFIGIELALGAILILAIIELIDASSYLSNAKANKLKEEVIE
jgi:hypothetical protein